MPWSAESFFLLMNEDCQETYLESKNFLMNYDQSRIKGFCLARQDMIFFLVLGFMAQTPMKVSVFS